MSKRNKIFSYIFLIAASALSIFPFLWMIIGATNSSTEITKGKMTFGGELINNITNLFIYGRCNSRDMDVY